MTAATRTLLAKEIRQHGRALGWTTALLGLAWFLGHLAQSQQARSVSGLEAVSVYLRGPLVGAALYLGHRLVVTELYGRTQRFVEALPVRRWHMGAVKAAFGLGWLLLWGLAAVAASAALAARLEPVDGRFLAILGARVAGHAFALWGVVFALGHFGRLRVLLGGVLVAGIWLLDRYTTWQMSLFGPFALVSVETLPFERQLFPAAALAEAAAVGGAGLLVAFILARVREGSLVEALARPISPREVAALVIVALGAASGFGALDRDRGAEPYAFTTSKVLRRELGGGGGGARLEIAYFDDQRRPSAERLAAALAPVLSALAGPQGLGTPLLPVRLVHAPDVPVNRPRSIQIHHRHGITGGVNLEALAGYPLTDTVAFVVHDLLLARLRKRAAVEDRHWLIDGFALHFTLHGGEAAAPPLDRSRPDPWLLRALAAAEAVPVDAVALRDYWITSERLGSAGTSALAASGWRVLERRAGRAAVLALARATLAREATNDLRDVLHDRRNPFPQLFARTTGLGWEAFLAAWRDDLRAARGRGGPLRDELAALPRPRVHLRAWPGGLAVAGTADPPPAAPITCQVLHRRLPPLEGSVDPDELEEVELVWPAGQRHLEVTVGGHYGSGERALVALDCQAPALMAPRRLLARRVTIE